MSATRKPWIKWYGADWRADPALRMCGFAARGLWMDMLTLMQEAEPFGHLVVKGRAPSPKQLATLLGGQEREVVKLLAELRTAGVFSETEDGVIYSRRMVRDKAKAEADAQNGRRGGNPDLKPPPNPPDKAGVNPPDKAHMPEARSQKPESTPPPSPEPARPDANDGPRWGAACKAIIRERWPNDAKVEMMGTGTASQWIADGYDLELDVLPIVRQIVADKRGGPITTLGYFTGPIGRRHAERTSGPEVEDPEAEAKLRATLEAAFEREGTWNENWPKWRDHWGARPDRAARRAAA